MEKKILIHKRAIKYIILFDRKKKEIEYIKRKLQIERAKPYTESFLTANEQWYLDQLEIKQYIKNRLAEKYNSCITDLIDPEIKNVKFISLYE